MPAKFHIPFIECTWNYASIIAKFLNKYGSMRSHENHMSSSWNRTIFYRFYTDSRNDIYVDIM